MYVAYMSKKLLVTGDLHFSDNPRDHYRWEWMKKFIKTANDMRPAAVVILGDLTEVKEGHSASLINAVVDHIWEISRTGIPVIGLQGNHDYMVDPHNGLWPFLRHIDNVAWITNPCEMCADNLGNATGLQDFLEIYPCLMLPHTRDYKQAWADVEMQGYSWIFAHNTFAGAIGANKFKLDGIPLSVFPSDAQVISGDIHVPQTIGPVTYVGAPYLCDFGDEYEPRVLLLDGDDAKSVYIPNAQKRLVEITDPIELKLHKKIALGDIVKVRVKLRMEDRENWPAMKEQIRVWAEAKGVQLDSATPQFEVVKGARVKFSSRSKVSDADVLKQYGQARGISADTLAVGLNFTK